MFEWTLTVCIIYSRKQTIGELGFFGLFMMTSWTTLRIIDLTKGR